MCIFLSAADIDGLVEELITGGYGRKTAVAVVYKDVCLSYKEGRVTYHVPL